MTRARIYLVDDNDGFRESTSWLLETANLEVQSFSSGSDFLTGYSTFEHNETPECLISDIRMPVMSGLQLQEQLIKQQIKIPIIFVTAHGDVPLAVEAMRKGAVNFLEKPFAEEELLAAIDHALTHAQAANVSSANAEALAKLSPRERQVLDLVIASKPNKIIADVLGISIKTVELHRANMMSKLGVRSLPDLMKVALGHG